MEMIDTCYLRFARLSLECRYDGYDTWEFKWDINDLMRYVT